MIDHSEEITRLRAALAEAEARALRAERERDERDARITDCEMSLALFDEGRVSEYWLRHDVLLELANSPTPHKSGDDK